MSCSINTTDFILTTNPEESGQVAQIFSAPTGSAYPQSMRVRCAYAEALA